MTNCNIFDTGVLQVYIKYVTSTLQKRAPGFFILQKLGSSSETSAESISDWVNWAGSFKYIGIEAIVTKYSNIIEVSKKVWSYLHSSGSIWLPRNGGLKYRDGSLDTRMRSELWLRRGSS